MRETAEDLARLDALLSESITNAGAFLRRSFQMPDRSLSAAELAARLQGPLVVALGTVTANGEPRVAPISAFFLRGRFHVPTVAEAARARHLARRPAVSLTYFQGEQLAVIAHGSARIISDGQEGFEELDAVQVEIGNRSTREWSGQGAYVRVDPAVLYTYERATG